MNECNTNHHHHHHHHHHHRHHHQLSESLNQGLLLLLLFCEDGTFEGSMAPEPEKELNEKNPPPLDEDDIALLKTYVTSHLLLIPLDRLLKCTCLSFS